MTNSNDNSLNIPQHIAIMMDGNRRWAKSKSMPTLEGHRKGVENWEKLSEAAKNIGVKVLSAWAFSTENWKREKEEVEYMFNLARTFTNYYKKKCLEEKVKFIHLGRKDRIPKDVMQTINEMEESTKSFTGFTVCLAIDYGGHDEIIRAVKKLQDQGLELNTENIENSLDTADLPMPDLLIRTGGEYRLSGFMSWQCAYAELYFSDLYFPDFDSEQLQIAIADYSKRDRRFGGNSKKQNLVNTAVNAEKEAVIS